MDCSAGRRTGRCSEVTSHIERRVLPVAVRLFNAIFAASVVVACAALIFQSFTRNDAQLGRLSGQVTVWSWAFAALGFAIHVLSKAVRRAELAAEDLDRQVADLLQVALKTEVDRQALLLGAGEHAIGSARIDLKFIRGPRARSPSCCGDRDASNGGEVLPGNRIWTPRDSGRGWLREDNART